MSLVTVLVHMILVEFEVVDGKHAGQRVRISKRKFLIGRDGAELLADFRYLGRV